MKDDIGRSAQIARFYGDWFVAQWEQATPIRRVLLVLGIFKAPALTRADLPDVPPATEQLSVRAQLGTNIHRLSQSVTGRLAFVLHLLPIGTGYLRRRAHQCIAARWDLGLPDDPFVSGDVTGVSVWRGSHMRRRALTGYRRTLESSSTSTRPHAAPFAPRLLYVSGMPCRETPSGYGRRTETIVHTLASRGVAVETCHLAFSAHDAGLHDNLSCQFDSDASLESLIETGTDRIADRARYMNAAVLAAGSNWVSGLMTWRAAQWLNRPFVYDVRGLWAMTRAAVEHGYARQPVYARQLELEWAVMRAADQVIVISKQLRDEAIKNGIDPGRIATVPNMTTFHAAAPSEPDPRWRGDQAWNLGYAGSLTRYESLEVAIKAVERLDAVGQRRLRLWIAGSGPDMNRLQSLASRSEDRIRFLGPIPHDHVRNLVRHCDLMIYPRQSGPLFDLVPALKPVETMGLGTPILMSDIAPHSDLAGENESRACLAPAPPPNSQSDPALIKAWAEHIATFLQEPEANRADRAERAKQWVTTHRTPDVAMRPWMTLFAVDDGRRNL